MHNIREHVPAQAMSDESGARSIPTKGSFFSDDGPVNMLLTQSEILASQLSNISRVFTYFNPCFGSGHRAQVAQHHKAKEHK